MDQGSLPLRTTVIIPTYHERYTMLCDALQSIEAQTVKPHQVIVICEEEWPRSAAGRFGLPLMFLGVEQVNLSSKVNHAMEFAYGQGIAVLCDDDKLAPTFIEQTSNAIEEGHDVAYTALEFFGLSSGVNHPLPWTEASFRETTVPYITSMFSRSIYDKVGGWDESLAMNSYADWAFWIRTFKAGAKAKYIPDPLFLYRSHGGQGTNFMDHQEARREIIAKYWS